MQDYPYASTDSATVLEESGLASKRQDWSTGLTWICILFVLIGVTGGFSAATNLMAALDQGVVTEKFGGDTPELQKEIMTRLSHFMPFKIFQEIVKFGLAVAFLMSALLMFGRQSSARRFVMMACTGAIAYHVAGTIMNFMMLASVSDIIAESSRAAMRSMGEDETIMNDMLGAAVTGFTIVTCTMMALRAGFYSLIMVYLSRPHIRAVFGENAFPELDEHANPSAAAEAALAGENTENESAYSFTAD